MARLFPETIFTTLFLKKNWNIVVIDATLSILFFLFVWDKAWCSEWSLSQERNKSVAGITLEWCQGCYIPLAPFMVWMYIASLHWVCSPGINFFSYNQGERKERWLPPKVKQHYTLYIGYMFNISVLFTSLHIV